MERALEPNKKIASPCAIRFAKAKVSPRSRRWKNVFPFRRRTSESSANQTLVGSVQCFRSGIEQHHSVHGIGHGRSLAGPRADRRRTSGYSQRSETKIVQKTFFPFAFVQMSDDSNPEFIHLERFLSVMNVVLKDRRYLGEPESKILRAFQVLDSENKGYLTEDEFRNFLCKEGSRERRIRPDDSFVSSRRTVQRRRISGFHDHRLGRRIESNLYVQRFSSTPRRRR